MAETVRMNLNVDPDIPEMLSQLAGGHRRMGAYMTDLIRSAHAGQTASGQPGEIELLTGAVRHLSVKVKELEARLTQVESKVG